MLQEGLGSDISANHQDRAAESEAQLEGTKKPLSSILYPTYGETEAPGKKGRNTLVDRDSESPVACLCLTSHTASQHAGACTHPCSRHPQAGPGPQEHSAAP